MITVTGWPVKGISLVINSEAVATWKGMLSMRLIDELRQAGVTGQLLDRADLIERAYEARGSQLAMANLPVKAPECSVTLTDAGWYEWVISGLECLHGYSTWREAHQAGCVALRIAQVSRCQGRMKGVVLHLRALIQALGAGTGCDEIVKSLRKVVKFLEEA